MRQRNNALLDRMLEEQDGIFNVYKPAGWTPVQAIERLKELYPMLLKQKVACAGRLDPMAEGVLIVLAGEALEAVWKLSPLG